MDGCNFTKHFNDRLVLVLLLSEIFLINMVTEYHASYIASASSVGQSCRSCPIGRMRSVDLPLDRNMHGSFGLWWK